MKKYALISVSDKQGIDELAIALTHLGYEIISTGGTARFLQEMGVYCIPISQWTGFPEIMDGRVKTLHPKVHGGILADRDKHEHKKAMDELGINAIDIVAVNLYPFKQIVANLDAEHADIIENIDIGGPSMVRSAAKNYRHVNILTDPRDYANTIEQLHSDGTSLEWRQYLAEKAFCHTADYDAAIAGYFMRINRDTEMKAGSNLSIEAELQQELRYGENPHQAASLYGNCMKGWDILHGKPLSFNNLLDLDASLRSIRLFDEPAVCLIKHTNPCGIGMGEDLISAYDRAFATDTLSPYGGIVVVNRKVDMESAQKINSVFTEILIAPGYDDDALTFLKKKKDRRLISFNMEAIMQSRPKQEIRTITFGYLKQDWDDAITDESGWEVVTDAKPDIPTLQALRFGWKVVSLLKSNAVVLTNSDRTLGLGMGQTSRVDCTLIAIEKATRFGLDLHGSICASDGFFPFRDSIELLHKQGVKAVIQPGGSKSDAEVIDACNQTGISMIFTHCRHFRH